MKKAKAFLKNESGQSLVEFALVLPILVLFLSSIADFGWVIINRVKLNDLTYIMAYSNDKDNVTDATSKATNYIDEYYPFFDAARMNVEADVTKSTYDYYEFIWNSKKSVYYRIPMKIEKMVTTMKIEYRISYLTAFGKVLFHDTDNEITLESRASSLRVLENDTRS